MVHFATHGLLAREVEEMSTNLGEPALALAVPRKATETMTLAPGHEVWYSLDRALPVVTLAATKGVDSPPKWVGTISMSTISSA